MRRQAIYSVLITIVLLTSSTLAQGLAKKEKNKTITPAAAGSVVGSGTPGRISKWSGVSGSSTYVLGDSNIFEDKFGRVGIGTTTPTSLLTVQGMIEITLGGLKFPDGTVQMSSAAGALFAVSGHGTPASPLSVVQSEALIEPVSNEIGINLSLSDSGDLFDVPAGKRLVIEHVSADCTVPTGQKVVRFAIVTHPANDIARSHILIPVFTGTRFVASQPIKLYADPVGAFAEVSVNVLRDPSTSTGLCTCSFSGFLVSLPAQSAMNRSPAFAVPARSETHVAGAQQ